MTLVRLLEFFFFQRFAIFVPTFSAAIFTSTFSAAIFAPTFGVPIFAPTFSVPIFAPTFSLQCYETGFITDFWRYSFSRCCCWEYDILATGILAIRHCTSGGGKVFSCIFAGRCNKALGLIERLVTIRRGAVYTQDALVTKINKEILGIVAQLFKIYNFTYKSDK